MKKSIYYEAKRCFIDTKDVKYFINLVQSTLFLEKLKEAIEKPLNMILLYGESGTGKTMLLNKLYSDISKKNKNIFLFSKPILDEKKFIKTLYGKLFNVYKNIDFNLFVNLVNYKLEFNSVTILLDEAQLYRSSQMEKIRIISDTKKIKFVIALHKIENEDVITKKHFQTRIWEAIELKPPTQNELGVYIKKKLLMKNLFNVANQIDNKCVKFIYKWTKGNFRETNRFLYHLFDMYEYYEKNAPDKIDRKKISKKFLEMNAIKLGYINV